MLEGGGLHPKVESTARCPGEGKGRGGRKQALEALEDESRHGRTPSSESNTETHTQTSFGERQEVVMEYLLGKGKKPQTLQDPAE